MQCVEASAAKISHSNDILCWSFSLIPSLETFSHLSATKLKTKNLQLDDKKFSIHTAMPTFAEGNQLTLKAIAQFLNTLTYENNLILQLQKWK